MKKILILFFLFTQLVAYAQVAGTPYMQPSSTNGTAVVSAYACINDFNPGTPFNSIAGGVLKVGTPVSGVTQSITATVIKTGTYNITTTTANGVTFSGSGTFVALGNQTIQLTATGTPIAKGNNTFTINTTPNCGCVRYTSVTGVYASVNGTLRDFGTHNLGADTNLDPKTYVIGNADGSGGTLGYLYQWGRTNDGHQLRNSPTVVGPKGPTDSDIAAGKFITNTGDWLSPNDNTLWRDGTTKGINDPCPPGFRVPTRTQWVNLYKVGSTGGNPLGPNPANWPDQNTWTWTGNSGYMIGPLLFLPVAGNRIDGSGTFTGPDSGRYWSSTFKPSIGTRQTQAYTIGWNSNGYVFLHPDSNGFSNKAYGLSVRCISE